MAGPDGPGLEGLIGGLCSELVRGNHVVTAANCRRVQRTFMFALTLIGALIAGLIYFAQQPAAQVHTAIEIAERAAGSCARVETVLTERTATQTAHLEAIRVQLARLTADVDDLRAELEALAGGNPDTGGTVYVVPFDQAQRLDD